MATKSNKLSQSVASDMVLDKFTKEQLFSNWQGEKALKKDIKEKYDNDLKSWNKEKEELIKTIEELRGNKVIQKNSKEVLKRILKMRAEFKSPTDIHYKLELLGVDIELEDIETFLKTDLSDELKEYFDKCKEKWIADIQMNSKEYRFATLEELQNQLDKFKKFQEYCPDPEMAHNVGKDILNLLEKLNKVAKDLDDITPDNKEKNRADEAVNRLLDKSKFVILQTDSSEMLQGTDNINMEDIKLN